MATYLVIGRADGTTIRRECTEAELAEVREVISQTLGIDASQLIVLELHAAEAQ